MAQNSDLGDLIMRLNPYTNHSADPPHNQGTGEMDIYINNTPTPGGAANGTIEQIELEVDLKYADNWSFKGQPQNIAKAARILYRYPVRDVGGNILYWAQDYLIIGFEGANGF